MQYYTLQDIIETNRKFPDTFWRPSDADLDDVKPGDLVKLIFCSSEAESSERMWVEVLLKTDNTFKGKLRNRPVSPVFGQFGDTITFEKKHIAAIDHPEETIVRHRLQEKML